MIRSITCIAIFLASAAVASAHHGFGTFELNKSVTFTGKLTRLEFINPHSWLYFEVTDANGKVTKHRCEMRSAHTLRRSGWRKELFPIGQQVTIEAAPDRADPQSCYLNTIRFANGTHMDRYGQYVSTGKNKVEEVRGPLARRGGGAAPAPTAARAARRASGEPNISGDWAPEQVVMADPRGRGGALVPLSTVATASRVKARGGGGGGGRGARSGSRASHVRRHRSHTRRRGSGGEVHAAGQPALQVPDDQHHLRLGVRRSRESHHAEPATPSSSIRPVEPAPHDPHEHEDPPGEREAEPRRPLLSVAGKATCSSSILTASCRAS